jgi:hypothetical protein
MNKKLTIALTIVAVLAVVILLGVFVHPLAALAACIPGSVIVLLVCGQPLGRTSRFDHY